MNSDVVLQALCSSAASSCLTAALLQPLDRLKTVKQQLNQQEQSAFKLTRLLVKKEGIRSLWTGLTPTLIRVVPGASLYLSTVNLLRTTLKIQDGNSFGLFLTGFASRSVVAASLQPTTVIKTRLESSLYQNKSLINAVQQVISQTGIKGLWRGLLPTLLRDAPFSGLYLLFYRRQLLYFNLIDNEHEENKQFFSRFHKHFLCGISAGFLACLLTQPFDIIKTVVLLYPQKFGNSAMASKNLYMTGGFRIFFTGFLLRATKRTLTAALTWTLFDEFTAYNRKSSI